ncbi:MAG: hypothetical protein ACI808_002649, partial [Paraglaciecola sp.]
MNSLEDHLLWNVQASEKGIFQQSLHGGIHGGLQRNIVDELL